jgi:hypothetical protein
MLTHIDGDLNIQPDLGHSTLYGGHRKVQSGGTPAQLTPGELADLQGML